MLKGLLAAGITMGIAAVFPQELAFPFFAGVLGLVAGTFPGFAMARREEAHPVLQWVVAVGVVMLGLAGLWASAGLLAAAWGLHALWSLLHLVTGLADEAPEGFPAFSLSFDLVTAAFVAYMWSVAGGGAS